MKPEDVALLRTWVHEPWTFARQALGMTPDAWQDEVLRALVTYDRLALKASKGVGKSTVLAVSILWYLSTRMHPKVVATSISGDNLRDGLWSELAMWIGRSPFLRSQFAWSAERIYSKASPETWWASARQWAKSADTAQQANTLAGIHADSVLFVIDEAGGVPDSVVAAAEAGLANTSKEHGREAKIILSGNPTHLSGPLYRACTRERDLWYVREISGDPDAPDRSPRVSAQWAREQIAKYGRDNPWVLVNVFGQFPPGQSNSLLGIGDVDVARKRVVGALEMSSDPKVLGVDVARFGDDESSFVLRQGRCAWKPKAFRNLDLMTLVGEICATMDKHKVDAAFVDSTGVGGGVIDRMRQLGRNAIGVDFGSGATERDRFANKRAEIWWQMAEWVKERGALPDDSVLCSELVAPTYSFSADGRLILESKAEMKKRGVASPNRADALALTFAHPVVSPAVRAMLGSSHKALTNFNPFERQK